MFFIFPVQLIPSLRQVVFLINTVLLIAALITVELVYSEVPKEKRRQLISFFPLFLVLSGLLIYAVHAQKGL
jgi:hypothetical protein